VNLPRRLLAAVVALPLAAALLPAAAGAQGFGRNKVQYRDFEWKIYHSPHFDVYYYPEEEALLEKVVSYAESSYDRLSRDFDHQIKKPVPLIFYATHSAFEQNNVITDFIQEGIGAFASPVRNRMVMPVDIPDPELLELISHELTHVFQYEILFQGKLSRAATARPPQWLMEGMASFVAQDESSRDRMFIRDVVVNDAVPPVSRVQGGGFSAYRLGHAVFDFMKERWGMEGFRDFVYEYRNSLGPKGVERALDRAFRLEPSEFDVEFRRWLRKQYLPELVRTGEPSDFGKPFTAYGDPVRGSQISGASSPSGDLVAAFSTIRDDIDIVLFDTRKREVIRNLTRGFSSKYQYLVAQEFVMGRKMGRDLSFSPDGNTLAVFAKRERGRSLLLIDVLTGNLRKLMDLTVEQPLAPAFSPDGNKVAFSGFRDGRFDIFEIDIETGALRNLTQDDTYDGAPVYAPDGKSLVISSVAGGHTHLYRMEFADLGKRFPLTHGDTDNTDAVFSSDGSRIYFTSDMSGVQNIHGLTLATGEIQQYTNAVTGCFMPTVMPQADGPDRILFSAYWKGSFDLYVIETPEPVAAATTTVRVATEPQQELERFEPDITVTLDDANKEDYKGFKLFVEDIGAQVGVNSDQTFVSDTYISFTDYLGDRRAIARFSSIETFSNFDIAYYNLKNRWQWGVRLFDDRTYFIGQDFTTGRIQRGRAAYKQTGAVASLSYPFSFYTRLEVGGGYILRDVDFQRFEVDPQSGDFVPVILPREDQYPVIELSLVNDNSVFGPYGAVSGRRFRLDTSYAPDLDKDQPTLAGEEPGGTLTSSVSLDYRQYIPVTQRSNFALRLFGAASSGNAPQPFYFGGLNTLRGFDFRDFVGNRAAFANIEYRFPLFDAVRGPVFNIQGIRGRLFLDIGAAWFTYGSDFKFYNSDTNELQDGRAAYGYGLTINLFGLDLNWDFAKQWKFAGAKGGYETSFWIGTQF
jgi:Tol biopolymer transport system component